jgi:D-3-phosphoglycerate dehydrogenase / 2-oxoglutarate reductase
VAHRFVAFVENVIRPNVVAKADAVAKTFDDVVSEFEPRTGGSARRERLRVLLLENVHPLAARHLRDAGHDVETLERALPEEELARRLPGVAILGIRSNTHVTRKALEKADDLIAIGAFCIGTNAIDLAAATQRGTAVFNAPYSNGRSVVELAIGLIVMLFRRIPDKAAQMHAGRWDKSAKGSHEIRGRTLGIVGYGNIGTQLSVVAESLGMEVRFFDVIERPSIGNAKRCETLDALLAASDVVTVHVDGRSANRGFLGAAQFAKMRPGALFLNLSRGFVLDEAALAEALREGHLAGAAVDVFPKEPRESPGAFDSPLRGLPNVILTPHVGGSTQEAQEEIARFMSAKLTSFVDTGSTMLSVNFPGLQLPALLDAHRLIHVHSNRPGVLAKINGLMGRHRMNILGQYLGTTSEIGYVITDVNAEYDRDILARLRSMPETLRVRMLY